MFNCHFMTPKLPNRGLRRSVLKILNNYNSWNISINTNQNPPFGGLGVEKSKKENFYLD